MTFPEYGRFFLRTPLGIASLAAGPVAALGTWGAGLGAPAAIGIGLLLPPFLATLFLLSGAGPRVAAREGERLAESRARRSLDAFRESLDRLEVLRIADAEIARARDAAALEAGRYLEAASGSATRDALAEAALGECIDLVQAWLLEADESAAERRFGTEDAHPFPEARARVVAALRDKASLIGRGKDAVEGLPPPPDRIAIEEELR